MVLLTWATSYHYYSKYPVTYRVSVPSEHVGIEVVKSEMRETFNVYLLLPFMAACCPEN